MPLTEAQRLAFLKGREKRMANLEKKKLEDKEALENEMMQLLKEEMASSAVAPEKPKVTRKPRKTKEVKESKIPVDVKIQPTPSEADTEPETEPETDANVITEKSAAIPAAPHPPVSQDSASVKLQFDEDAIANKVVAMLLEKGVGVPAPNGDAPAIKNKKPTAARKSVKPKDTSNSNTSGFSRSFPPASASFSWM
jgi:hypothetical protein